MNKIYGTENFSYVTDKLTLVYQGLYLQAVKQALSIVLLLNI